MASATNGSKDSRPLRSRYASLATIAMFFAHRMAGSIPLATVSSAVNLRV